MKKIDKSLIENIKQIVRQSRQTTLRTINNQLINTYWNIGREIVDSEQKQNIDPKSARQLILELSKQLSRELEKGFSRSNLFNMRKLYLFYPDVQTLSGHLS